MTVKLRFVSTPVYLFISFEEREIDGEVRVFGTDCLGDLVNNIFTYLNQSVRPADLLETEEAADYGEVIGPGNGTGMIGFLLRNESDMALFPMTPTYETQLYVDFLHTFWAFDLKLISGPPIYSSDMRFQMQTIYGYEVWLSMLCSVFVLSSLLRLKITISDGMPSMNLSDCFFYIISTIVFQAPGFNNPTLALFWFYGTFLLACFVILYSFSGCLLSKIAITEQPKYIENVDSVLGTTKACSAANVEWQLFINTSIAENVVNLYRHMVKRGSFDSFRDHPTEIIENIHNGKGVLLCDKIGTDMSYVLFGHCEPENGPLHFSQQTLDEPTGHFAMRKGVDPGMRDRAETLLLRFFEASWIDIKRARMSGPGVRCNEEKQSKILYELTIIKALSLDSFLLAFGFLSIGSILATLSLFIELRINHS